MHVARRVRPILAAMLAVAAMPAAVRAQAICSAPHSSPSLTQSGAIRTLPQGAGWVQLSLSGQRATESFNPLGDRQRFLSDSEFDTRSAYVTGAYGVVTGLEVWAQAPVHHLNVEASSGASTSRGIGDLRGAIRLSLALVGWEFPVAFRAGLKVPGSEFPVDATELPLTEGQRDLEVSVESGWAPDFSPVYVVGWAGFRWRAADAAGRHEPGDEGFAHLAFGGVFESVNWEVGFDGLWGGAPTQQGLEIPGSARRLLQLLPTIGVGIGPGRLELTTPIPMWGKNLPAGYGISLGYRVVWGMD